MKITAYIPAYNVAKYLGPTIESLLNQTLPPQELLLIDDGSTDRTLQVAEAYTDPDATKNPHQVPVRIIRHEKNKGLAAARNTAFAHAQHEFVAAMDSDAIADPAWLEYLAPAFDDPEIAGAGGRLIETQRTGLGNAWRSTYLLQDLGERPITMQGNDNRRLGGFGTIFRKSVVQSIGGYNESFRTNNEDVDLGTRLLAAGYKLHFEPRAISLHQRTDTVKSALRMAWQWGFWEHYYNGGYNNIALKVLHNFRRARTLAWDDLRAHRTSFLYVDFLGAWYHSYLDLQYRYSSRRMPPVQASPGDSAKYYPRLIRTFMRPHKS
jgi:glycosyltransferase involved in cell wall biosynthesis